MKREALLVSIRRIRMIEVDGLGTCVQVDLVIERPRRGRGDLNDGSQGRLRSRWEAS